MKYKNLLGKTKNDILDKFGDEFNYYRSSTWTYIIEQKWYRSKTLYLFFDEKDIVYKVDVKNQYFFW